MSSPDSAPPDAPRSLGPVQILERSLTRQLLGLGLALVGISIVSWVIESSPPLWSVIAHTAVGSFAVFNGLYLGGVRFR